MIVIKEKTHCKFLKLFCSTDILSKKQKQRELDDSTSLGCTLSWGARCALRMFLLFTILCLLVITTLWSISPHYFMHPPTANVTNSTDAESESQHLSLARSSQIIAGGVLLLFVVTLFFLLCCNNDSFSTTFRLIFYPIFTKLPIAPRKSAIVKESDNNLRFGIDSKSRKKETATR